MEDKFLNYENALLRSKLISTPLEYKLILGITKSQNYKGFCEIKFTLSSVPLENQTFFVDYSGKQLLKVELNSKQLDIPKLWNGNFLQIPNELCCLGANTLHLTFENDYSTDGQGFHKFIDNDSKQYIYSHFEPDSAHKMFPCFDQPDLKATYQFLSFSPQNWLCISNETGKIVKQIPSSMDFKVMNEQFWKEFQNTNEYEIWSFEKSVIFSTYIVFFGCGEYSKLKIENSYNNIPMCYYCRQSLHDQLKENLEKFSQVINEAIPTYEQFFQYQFPYPKYDHIFCPEYNIGAMENVGAVTVNDLYLSYSPFTKLFLTKVLVVLCHELCHVWFGDLVTMKWWNDLWLKESFADFMGHWVLSQFQKNWFEDPWILFNRRVEWGMDTDSIITTHPISVHVSNTEMAKSIFDGISYAKGAAVLKQLLYLVGRDNFSNAMKEYFEKYKWSVADLEEFMQIFSKFFKIEGLNFNLDQWQKEWIQKAGLNTITCDWNDSKITFKQSNVLQEFSQYRYHSMEICLFTSVNNYQTHKIILPNTESFEFPCENLKQIQAIYPNYNDNAFIKVYLDKRSIEFFKTNFNLLNHSLTQQMIIKSIYYQIADGVSPSTEFFNFVLEIIPNSKNLYLISLALEFAQQALQFWTPFTQQTIFAKKLFQVTLNCLEQQMQQQDKSHFGTLINYLTKFAQQDKESLLILMNYLMNDTIYIKTAIKWNIVLALASCQKFSNEEKQKAFSKVQNEDTSDFASKIEKQYQIILINDETKLEEVFQQKFLVLDSKISKYTQIAEMEGFVKNSFLINSSEETKIKYAKLYFGNLQKIFTMKNISLELQLSYMKELFPNYIDEIAFILQEVKEQLELVSENQISLKRFLLEKEGLFKQKAKSFKISETK